MKPPEFDLDKAHRYFAATLNGECWKLIDQTSRTAEEDRRMLMAAFASNYHWLQAGDAVNQQRGEWLIAKAYAALNDGPSCLKHARNCMEWTETHPDGLADFDFAYAHEMLARGCALTSDTKRAAELKAKARELGEQLANPEDKKIFMSDLAWGDWKGVE